MSLSLRYRQRRQLLKLALLGSGASLLGSQTQLGLIRSALAADGYAEIRDYKSLVCIFLPGGNDATNTIIPIQEPGYGRYQRIRQHLAIGKNRLLPLAGTPYGLHPALPQTRALYNHGRLAIVANVGALQKPTTREDYRNRRQIPDGLFSHSHQQNIWQSARMPSGNNTPQVGWGGLIADKLALAHQSNIELPPAFSLNGSNLWQNGTLIHPLSISPSGSNEFRFYAGRNWLPWESSRMQAWNAIRQMSHAQPLQSQASKIMENTRVRTRALEMALVGSPDLKTPVNLENPLAHQLHTVARLIAVRQQLGLKRQIFFVQAGAWDTHGSQLARHHKLLGMLDQALGSFAAALQELQHTGVIRDDSVTGFTASEFGRTLTGNGDGTDHGWSSSHLVFGGAVQGGQIHGALPELAIGGPNDAFDAGEVPAGRLIPKYSIDQYGATLAHWMGLKEIDLADVFPHLGYFVQKDLGFMRRH